MATKKEMNTKKELENKILLTEEEYSKKLRQQNKERINRVLRVVGLVASFILIYVGLFDVLFELSYFGWIADKIAKTNVHEQIWNYLGNNESLGGLSVFDDPLMFNNWVPKLGLTAVLILSVVGTVYLFVYSIVDVIALLKRFIVSSQELTRDLTGTVKDTVMDDKELISAKKRRAKDLFADNEGMFEKKEEKKSPFRFPKVTRRKEEKPVDSSEIGGLTEEQLDRLLNGEELTELELEDSKNKEEA